MEERKTSVDIQSMWKRQRFCIHAVVDIRIGNIKTLFGETEKYQRRHGGSITPVSGRNMKGVQTGAIMRGHQAIGQHLFLTPFLTYGWDNTLLYGQFTINRSLNKFIFSLSEMDGPHPGWPGKKLRERKEQGSHVSGTGFRSRWYRTKLHLSWKMGGQMARILEIRPSKFLLCFCSTQMASGISSLPLSFEDYEKRSGTAYDPK